MKLGDLRQLNKIEGDRYYLNQIDYEIDDIFKSIGYSGDGFSFIVVKYDDSGADYAEVWGGDSPNSHSNYELIYFK